MRRCKRENAIRIKPNKDAMKRRCNEQKVKKRKDARKRR